METFYYSPDYSAKVEKKPSVSTFKYGDGYAQRTTTGIVTVLEEWDLKFARDPSTIADIEAFLVSHGGFDSFEWTTPKGKLKKFVCEEWNVSEEAYNTIVLSAKFVEEA